MKILKFCGRLAGLAITLSILLAAVSVISERADESFSNNGAYTSSLLVWKQEYAGKGDLIILGNPIEIDLERLSELAKRLSLRVNVFLSEISEESQTAVRGAVEDVMAASELPDEESGIQVSLP